MFGLFKGKTEKEKLQKKYEKILKEAHELSTTNRAASDKKQAEAQEVLQKIEQLPE
ncbi:MAG: Lacal_2735 family protein [Owenweeksia sp.]|nr:Lacal_2735 family protein [Owenweeksia sp.]